MPSAKKFLISVTAFGFFAALFPWFFAYQGVIAGMPVSIRALGDAIGVVCVLIGTALLLSKAVQNKTKDIGSALEQASFSQQTQLIYAAVLLYGAGVVSHKLRAQYVIGTHAFDLGFFSNICWNTLQGDWFYSSLLERNFMAVHVNWILWPLAYLYALFRGAEALLIAQAVLVAATIPVLWRTVQKITGSFSAGMMASILFVSSPYIEHVVLNDFHPDVWQLPCLFFAMGAWQNKNSKRLIFFSLLAILAKEDVSVILCGFGLFLMLQKSWRRTGVILFAASLAIFIFHTQFFTPRYLEEGQTSILYSRYSFLGGNFGEMAANLVRTPHVYAKALFYDPAKFWRLACYFFPVGGLTLLSPLFLLPPVISVMPHLLSQASTQLSLADIYSLPSQPFIFVGAAAGAKRLLERFGRPCAVPLTGFLFIVAAAGIFNSPRAYRSENPERIQAFYDMKHLVPADASMAAQQNILPHFDTRRYIQMFPIRLAMPGLQTKFFENPEYIACDRIGNALPWNGPELAEAIATFEKNTAYEKIYERDNFILFKRVHSEELRWRTS